MAVAQSVSMLGGHGDPRVKITRKNNIATATYAEKWFYAVFDDRKKLSKSGFEPATSGKRAMCASRSPACQHYGKAFKIMSFMKLGVCLPFVFAL
jgi:hypothetical protein